MVAQAGITTKNYVANNLPTKDKTMDMVERTLNTKKSHTQGANSTSYGPHNVQPAQNTSTASYRTTNSSSDYDLDGVDPHPRTRRDGPRN